MLSNSQGLLCFMLIIQCIKALFTNSALCNSLIWMATCTLSATENKNSQALERLRANP